MVYGRLYPLPPRDLVDLLWQPCVYLVYTENNCVFSAMRRIRNLNVLTAFISIISDFCLILIVLIYISYV